MLCSSCGSGCGKDEPAIIKSLRLDLSKYKIEGEIIRLNCGLCDNFIAVKITGDGGSQLSATGDSLENCANHDDVIINIAKEVPGIVIGVNHNDNNSGWKQVKTRVEKIVYYVLSQIVYPERDSPNADKYESMYDFADECDLVMLRWERGVAIGFYTLKLKGTKILSTNEIQQYAMTTLDTAYVRSDYRNRGIGVEILRNITETFEDQDVGFSRPISEGMWKVLEKFLTVSKKHRLKFWEIQEGGDEGNKKLIWFTILKKRKLNKPTNNINNNNNINDNNDTKNNSNDDK